MTVGMLNLIVECGIDRVIKDAVRQLTITNIVLWSLDIWTMPTIKFLLVYYLKMCCCSSGAHLNITISCTSSVHFHMVEGTTTCEGF